VCEFFRDVADGEDRGDFYWRYRMVNITTFSLQNSRVASGPVSVGRKKLPVSQILQVPGIQPCHVDAEHLTPIAFNSDELVLSSSLVSHFACFQA
jgi:hypothetical protein